MSDQAKTNAILLHRKDRIRTSASAFISNTTDEYGMDEDELRHLFHKIENEAANPDVIYIAVTIGNMTYTIKGTRP